MIGIIEKYKAQLPLKKDTVPITLGEGNTPLLRLNNIISDLPISLELYIKYEGMNPTGSFKDRGMAVAVTKAVEDGAKAIICASTGNTSASAAAYAARAGIRAFVLIPAGQIAQGKLAQAMLEGATILQIKGNFDDGMRLVKKVSDNIPLTIVNSINPYRLQGQKTAVFEIIEILGKAPDFHCLPVGNAGNITAYWIGYNEAAAKPTKACQFCAGKCTFKNKPSANSLPKMIGYQASGAAPFLRKKMLLEPETVATAIRIGQPQSWESAWTVQQESGGWFSELSDTEILAAQKLLAEREGIFCEPASAASVAGILKDIKLGKIPEGSIIVCTLTGHGLKDPDIAIKQSEHDPRLIDNSEQAVLDTIEDHL